MEQNKKQNSRDAYGLAIVGCILAFISLAGIVVIGFVMSWRLEKFEGVQNMLDEKYKVVAEDCTPHYNWWESVPKINSAGFCGEDYEERQVQCDCAKNTNHPCLAYCAQCIKKEAVKVK